MIRYTKWGSARVRPYSSEHSGHLLWHRCRCKKLSLWRKREITQVEKWNGTHSPGASGDMISYLISNIHWRFHEVIPTIISQNYGNKFKTLHYDITVGLPARGVERNSPSSCAPLCRPLRAWPEVGGERRREQTPRPAARPPDAPSGSGTKSVARGVESEFFVQLRTPPPPPPGQARCQP